MEIDNILKFDRKHYFYSDLPKGYQITQEDRPIGKNGYIIFKNGKRIDIERLHIEEDTCKQIHRGQYTYLNFNRCDVPLIEVVTSPNIESGDEAKEVAKIIRDIVTRLDISAGKMEEGSLRVDVNVSLSDASKTALGTKVEIKNLNTFENIKKAVSFEIYRQKPLILAGKSIKQETFRFDEELNQNVLMRNKEDFVDYRVFTDPNLPPYRLSQQFIESCFANEKEDLEIFTGLDANEVDLLNKNNELLCFYKKVIQQVDDHKLVAKYLLNEIKGILKIRNISLNDYLSSDLVAIILNAVNENKINSLDAKKLLNDLSFNAKDLELYYSKENEIDVNCLIKEVLNENPAAVLDFKNGKDKALGFLLKKVIDKARNNINIKKAKEVLLKELSKGE